ncbi:ADP-ribosylglycohydrolase [Burkholderia phage vB_BpP_HN04]|nr:ADP-ribosylglycohydrolase [Burkholderia phage vB_BpP_HN01]
MKGWKNDGSCVFVFGSNEGGKHGAGAARTAYNKYGARWNFSYGHMGNSFAIPTKDFNISKTLSLRQIHNYVTGFLAYAEGHPDLTFYVTRIGCGLAGLEDKDIAQMFHFAPANCLFDEEWIPYLGTNGREYWGTFE